MKKILLAVLLGGSLCLFSGALLLADGAKKEQQKEPYDEDTYGPEAPIVWEKPVKAVVFEHKVHTKDAGLSCDSCHDSIFEMEKGAAEQKDDFTMEKLYKGSYCGACHDGSTAFASNTRCTSCHIGVRGNARLSGDGGTVKKSH
jgi:c(7)-type cytochrome triheme protein